MSKVKLICIFSLERMSAGPNSSASKQLNRILQHQQLKHQQIACINQLQLGLQRPQSLVSQSVAAYSYLLDGEPLKAMPCFPSSSAGSCTGQGAPAPDRFPTVHPELLLNIALEVQREVLADGVRGLPTQHEGHAAVIRWVLLSACGTRLQGAVKTSEQDMEVQLPSFVPQPVSGCAPCEDTLMICWPPDLERLVEGPLDMLQSQQLLLPASMLSSTHAWRFCRPTSMFLARALPPRLGATSPACTVAPQSSPAGEAELCNHHKCVLYCFLRLYLGSEVLLLSPSCRFAAHLAKCPEQQDQGGSRRRARGTRKSYAED